LIVTILGINAIGDVVKIFELPIIKLFAVVAILDPLAVTTGVVDATIVGNIGATIFANVGPISTLLPTIGPVGVITLPTFNAGVLKTGDMKDETGDIIDETGDIIDETGDIMDETGDTKGEIIDDVAETICVDGYISIPTLFLPSCL
jgi:hypothetical protein